jgi:hypothetical protein
VVFGFSRIIHIREVGYFHINQLYLSSIIFRMVLENGHALRSEVRPELIASGLGRADGPVDRDPRRCLALDLPIRFFERTQDAGTLDGLELVFQRDLVWAPRNLGICERVLHDQAVARAQDDGAFEDEY